MRSGTGKDDEIFLLFYMVDQQKITADVAFPMISPLSRQLVITQLRRQ